MRQTKYTRDDYDTLCDVLLDQAFGPLFGTLTETQCHTSMTILACGLSSKSPSGTFHVKIDENEDATEVKDMLEFLNEKGLVSIQSDPNEIKQQGVFLRMETHPMTLWPSMDKQAEYAQDVNRGLTTSVADANDALDVLRDKQRKYQQNASLYLNKASALGVSSGKQLLRTLL